MAKIKKGSAASRAKLGLPAKAGHRRPPTLVSKRDSEGKRQWHTASSKKE